MTSLASQTVDLGSLAERERRISRALAARSAAVRGPDTQSTTTNDLARREAAIMAKRTMDAPDAPPESKANAARYLSDHFAAPPSQPIRFSDQFNRAEVEDSVRREPEIPAFNPDNPEHVREVALQRKYAKSLGGDASSIADADLFAEIQRRKAPGQQRQLTGEAPQTFGRSFSSEFVRSIEPFTPFIPIETRDRIRNLTRPGEGTGGFLGNVTGSIVPSAAALATGGLAAVPVAAAYAGKAASDAYERSGSVVNAIGHGVFEGGSEFLGGRAVRKLSEEGASALGRAVLKKDWAAAREVFKTVLGGANVEGLEEVVSSVGGILTDAVTGEEGDLRTPEAWGRIARRLAREPIQSYLGGLIAGGTIETPAAIGGASLRARAARDVGGAIRGRVAASADPATTTTDQPPSRAAEAESPQGSEGTGTSPDPITREVEGMLTARGVPPDQVQSLAAAVIDTAGGNAEEARFIAGRVQPSDLAQEAIPPPDLAAPISSSSQATGRRATGRSAQEEASLAQSRSPEQTKTSPQVEIGRSSGQARSEVGDRRSEASFTRQPPSAPASSPPGSENPSAPEFRPQSTQPAETQAGDEVSSPPPPPSRTEGTRAGGAKATARTRGRTSTQQESTPPAPATNTPSRTGRPEAGGIFDDAPPSAKPAGVEPEGSHPPPAPAAARARDAARAGEPGGEAEISTSEVRRRLQRLGVEHRGTAEDVRQRLADAEAGRPTSNYEPPTPRSEREIETENAAEEAARKALRRLIASRKGWRIDSVSDSGSLYAVHEPSKTMVRISDHYVPETEGGGRAKRQPWSVDLVGRWRNAESEFKKAAADVEAEHAERSPVPARAKTKEPNERVVAGTNVRRISRPEILKRIERIWEDFGGRDYDLAKDHEDFDKSEGASENAFSFGGAIPTELIEATEHAPYLRAMLRKNVRGGGGDDTLATLGTERFLERLEATGSSKGRRYLDYLKKNVGGNMPPEQRAIIDIYEQLLDYGESKPRIDIISDPKKLPAGTKLTIAGEEFTLVPGRDGTLELVDGENLGPVEFFAELPADTGSLDVPPNRAEADRRVAAKREEAAPDAFSETKRDLIGQPVAEKLTGSQKALFETRKQEPSEIERETDEFQRRAGDEAARDKDTGRLFGGSGSSSALGSPGHALGAPPSTKELKRRNRIQVEPETGGASTKTVRQIILDLQANTGRVRAGKPHGHSVGTYYPGSAKTVIRFSGDLDTTAHEVAHRLDDLYGIVADWATPRGYDKRGRPLPQKSPFDAELRAPIFQTTSRPRYKVVVKRAEGVAEYLRAWMLNPAEAEKAAPAFTAFVKQKVPAEALGKLRDFGDDIRRWAGLSNADRVAANIEMSDNGRGAIKALKEAVQGDQPGEFQVTALDRLNAATLDSLAPLWKAVGFAKKLRGLGELLPSMDPKMLVRTFAGFDAKFSDVMQHGPLKGDNTRADGVGGVDWLLEPLNRSSKETLERDMRSAVAFMVSERVVERAKAIDDARDDSATIIDQIREKMEEIAEHGANTVTQQELDELKRDLRQTMRKVGYDGPYHRFWEWGEVKKQRLAGIGGGIYSDTEQAKAALDEFGKDPDLLGRVKEAARRYRAWASSVLDYAVSRGRLSAEARDAIKENNRFYVSFQRISDEIAPEIMALGTGRRLGSSREVVRRFKGGTKPIQNPYVSLLQQTYAIMRESDRNAALNSFVDLIRPSNRDMYQGRPIDLDQLGSIAKEGEPDTIRVFNKGRAERWQFNPDLYAALKNWGETEPSNIVYRLLQVLPRLSHSAITHSPAFIIRNALRDPMARAIVSDTGSKPWGSLYYATKAGASEFDADLSRFRRSGGALFGHYLPDRRAYYREMQNEIRKASKAGDSIFTVPARAWRAWSRFAQGSETVGRMAEFRSAYDYARRKLGYSEMDANLYAAAKARDLADYAVSGTAVRQINKYLIFTNAATQSLARTIRGVRADPARFAARWLVYLAVPEIAVKLWNAAMGAEDDERELSPIRRDMFWNYRIANWGWLSIPKPWELGALGSIIGRSIDAARGADDPYEGWIGSVLKASVPVDEGSIAGPAKALVEGVTNYDFFTGRNIVPSWETTQPVEFREGTKDASRLGQTLQSALGVDARKIDHFVGSQFSDFGRAVSAASDAGRDGWRGDQLRLATGIMRGNDSPQASGNYRWVMQMARENDAQNSAQIRWLRELSGRWRVAREKNDREKMNVMAGQIKKYARTLRQQWTKNPPRRVARTVSAAE